MKRIQLEERVSNLEHEDMRVTVVMHDENALHGATHAKVLIIVLKTLQTSGDRWIFFGLCLLGAADRM